MVAGNLEPLCYGEKMQSRKLPVELARSTQLLDHGPVTLITSHHAGRSNVMAASWAMPLDFNPPKVIVIVDSKTLTRELIEASGEFGLQIPLRGLAQKTLSVGSHSGRDLDKFSAFELATFPAQKIAAPMLEGCAGWLECRVIPDASQRLDIFIAEVVAAYSNAQVYSNNRWHFGEDPLHRTIHYVAGGQFFATGEAFQTEAL